MRLCDHPLHALVLMATCASCAGDDEESRALESEPSEGSRAGAAESDTESAPLPLPSRGTFLLIDASLYQVIGTRLADEGGLRRPDERDVPIVANRQAQLALALDVPDGSPHNLDVTVEIDDGEAVVTYAGSGTLNGDSVPSDPSSTLLVDLPSDAVQEGVTFAVAVRERATQETVLRVPQTGRAELGALALPAIKAHFVPYRVDGFTPSVTPEIIRGYESAVLAVYPTAQVEISVGPVRDFWTNDVGEVLVDVGALQEQDEPPVDVYYFGLVSGAATRAEFQGSTGTSENGGADPQRAFFAAGAAFGDDLSESTFVHELGHVFGLEHSPCGDPPDVDSAFPLADGSTGALGFDFRSDSFLAADTADLMGYCQPRWIGPYHYQLLFEHLRASQTWTP